MEEKKEMTVREAGKKGGDSTKEKHGVEYFSRIGKLGGRKILDERGYEFYAEIGRKGGLTNVSRGKEYFSELGKKGGAKTAELHGQKHYQEIGARGGRKKAGYITTPACPKCGEMLVRVGKSSTWICTETCGYVAR